MSQRWICLATVVISLTCAILRGQNITGSILGQVADASGSAIPGAAVLIKSTETGVASQTVTDGSGSYSIPNLLASIYEITVRKEGFQTVTVRGIELLSAQTLRQDVTLQVGAVQQSVEVVGQALLIHTDSNTIGTSMGSRQLSDLPLSGRTVDSLIGLAAGVETGGTNPRISGSSYWGGTNFTLNGVSVNDSANTRGQGASGVTGFTFVNFPAPDSLQEFKIDSGTQNAEFRNVASIMMVLKQGSNAFHGMAYNFLQNEALNANTFLLNATGRPRVLSRLNQFGADLGGPLIRNKLFFYGAYRGVRNKFPRTTNLAHPSMAMRQGDFSALCQSFANGNCVNGTQLFNPFTGAAFPNNQIPSNLITRQARALLDFLPPPTDSTSRGLPNGSPNYIAPVPNDASVNGVDFRADWQARSSDSFNSVFHWSRGSPWFLSGGNTPANYGNNSDSGYTNISVSLTHTHIFNPTTINEFRAAWVVHSPNQTGQNTDFNPATLFPQLPIVDNGGLPRMTMTGYTGMFSDAGKGYPYPEYDIEFVENLSKVHGRHTFKFGATEVGYKNYTRQGGQALTGVTVTPLGSFNFNGQWTGNRGWPGLASSQGNSFADFLLGVPSATSFAGPQTDYQVSTRLWEFYAQDTFQVTPKLTLNYGVRYMYQPPWHVRDYRVTYLDLRNNKLAIPQDSDTLTFPRLAVPELISAYPYETTKQAGWTKRYSFPDKNNIGPRFGFAWRPFSGSKTVLRGGWGIYYDSYRSNASAYVNIFNPPWRTGSTWSSRLPGRPTAPFLPDLTFDNPFPTSAQAGPPSNPLIYMIGQDNVNPISQQWTLTAEQQLRENWLVRASYIGALTRRALFTREDINRPNVQRPNIPLQNQRPYQPWGEIGNTHTDGVVKFHQLQMELKKRLSNGLLVETEYSWTRSRDDVPVIGGAQNPNDHHSEFGNSEAIPRQILLINFVYDLPFGNGRAFKLPNRVLDTAVGGWSLSGIANYRTGAPITGLAFTVPSSIVGWWGGRPDAVAGGKIYANRRKDSHDVIGGVQWFNPDAFQPPQPWMWGNAERNSVYGPGSWTWDLGVQKFFAITETHRVQFRADFLNAFNHFNLGTPNANIADTRDGGLPNPNAGKIFGGSGSRVIQLGLKYMF